MLENLPGVKSGLEAAGCSVTTYKGLEISRKGRGWTDLSDKTLSKNIMRSQNALDGLDDRLYAVYIYVNDRTTKQNA